MTYKKYELTDETTRVAGKIVYRIRALRDFGDVKAGDHGGYVESERNLDHDGDCWIYDDAKAKVFGNARVSGNAQVYGNAQVFGNARVSGNAIVYGNASVYENAWVYEMARVYGNASVYGNAIVYGNADIYGKAQVYDAWVFEDAEVYGDAKVFEYAKVYGNAEVFGDAKVYGNAEVYGSDKVYGNAQVLGKITPDVDTVCTLSTDCPKLTVSQLGALYTLIVELSNMDVHRPIQKIMVIKLMRGLTKLGLKECKDLVECASEKAFLDSYERMYLESFSVKTSVKEPPVNKFAVSN